MRLKISLGGRIMSAHKRQIKIPVCPRSNKPRVFVHHRGHEPSTSDRSRKRRRELNESDSDSDFYGFAADSTIFDEPEMITQPSARDPDQQEEQQTIRRSSRPTRKKKKPDFFYFD